VWGIAWARLRARPDLGVFVGLLLLVFAAEAPVLHLPYYWDEAGWAGAAHWLGGQNLLRAIPGLRSPDTFWGHPPGLHVVLATLFKVFGDSRVVAHFLAVSLAFVGVYFTYRLGSLLYDRPTGACAALALFLSPVYFAQSAMFLADVPVAALGVAAVYFALRDNYAGYLLSAIPLVLVKETGAAVVAALLLFVLWSHRRRPGAAVRDLARYAVPLVAISGFLAWQKLMTGEFFFILGGMPFEFLDVGLGLWWSKCVLITRWLFWDQLRFIPTALAVVAIVRAPGWRSGRGLRLFGLIVLASCYPFVFIYLLRRYLMPALPFLYILGMGALTALIRPRLWRYAAAAGILAVSAASLADLRLRGNGEWTMSYLTVVRSAQATYPHLQEHYRNARVLAAWPDTVNLTRPYIGYVETPVKVVWYKGEPALGDYDVMLVSWPSAGAALREYAARQVAMGALRLVDRRERDGVWAEVYMKTADGPRPPDLRGASAETRPHSRR